MGSATEILEEMCARLSKAAKANATLLETHAAPLLSKESDELYARYKRLLNLGDGGEAAAERWLMAHADDSAFVARVFGHKAARRQLEANGFEHEEARLQAKLAREKARAVAARAAFRERWYRRGRVALGVSWRLIEAIAVGGVAGYGGRLIWADLVKRYGGG